MSVMVNIKRGFHKAVFQTKKHSPAILMTLSGAAFVATIIGVYKATPKVEAIVEDLETKRASNEPVDKVEVVKDLGKAMVWPITTSALTIACAIGAYNIQRNRILGLAGALASAKATQEAFEHKFKKKLGEAAYNEIMTSAETEYKDAETGETLSRVDPAEFDENTGKWFSDSEEYVRDDHTYNMQLIQDKIRTLDMKLFAKGFLLLNEVLETLGFERTRSGALLGWTASDFFNIETIVGVFEDPKTHQFRNDIFIKWNPKYIYGEMDFGRSYIE